MPHIAGSMPGQQPTQLSQGPFNGGEVVTIAQNPYYVSAGPDAYRFDTTGRVSLSSAAATTHTRFLAMQKEFPALTGLFAAQFVDARAYPALTSLVVPTAAHLNTFKQEALEPLGANTGQFEYDATPGMLGISSEQATESFSRQRFLIPTSNVAEYTVAYATGQMCLPQTTMDAASKIVKRIADWQKQTSLLKGERAERAAQGFKDKLVEAFERETRLWKMNLGKDGAGILVLASFREMFAPDRTDVKAKPRSAKEKVDLEFIKESGLDEAVQKEADEQSAYYAAIRDRLAELPTNPIDLGPAPRKIGLFGKVKR